MEPRSLEKRTIICVENGGRYIGGKKHVLPVVRYSIYPILSRVTGTVLVFVASFGDENVCVVSEKWGKVLLGNC